MANLAAKYRPKEFSDVSEQSVIVNMLKNICAQPEINHRNFLFIGPAGTGKTTSARIVANMINDNQGAPIEVDAASNNGVDSVRELVKQMRSYPVGCKYKVFIFDEVHAFSASAWQILLKPIEEQPARSIIILCTTNPEKIPQTILSRVQTFQLSKISLEGITNRLKHIVEEENKEGRGITYTEDAISYIAKMANGGMRDAITLLEKSLSYSNDINIENLTKSLDLPDYDDYFTLLNGIAKRDNTVIVKTIHDVYNSGVNFTKWFEGFHSFVSNIIKYIFIQDINATMIPSHYKEKIANYGTAHATLCLKLANKLVKMNNELKTTQYLQELAITYLCTMPTPAKKS
jgi:DNA polymerase-3 subunit gamma/tau